MLLGRQTKLFSLRSISSKENKQPISLGISLRLQSRKFNIVKEHKPNKEDNPMVFAIFGLEENGRRSYQDVELNGDNPLHPLKDSALRFF